MTNEVKVVLQPRVGSWVQIDAMKLTGGTLPKGNIPSAVLLRLNIFQKNKVENTT